MKGVVSDDDILFDVVIKINLLFQNGDDCLDSFPRVKHVEIVYHLHIELCFRHEIVVDMGNVSKTLVFLSPFVNHGRWDSNAYSNESATGLFTQFISLAFKV